MLVRVRRKIVLVAIGWLTFLGLEGVVLSQSQLSATVAKAPVQESSTNTIDAAKAELQKCQKNRNKKCVASSLMRLGLAYRDELHDIKRALEYLNQGLPIVQELDDSRGQAAFLGAIAATYVLDKQDDKAIEFYNLALVPAQKIPDKYFAGTILNNIGLIYAEQGQREKALDLLGQALQLSTEGQREKALDLLGQALQLSTEGHSDKVKAASLTNIGRVLSETEPEKALDPFNQALPILHNLKEETSEGEVHTAIGLLYLRLHAPDKALSSCNKALQIIAKGRDQTYLVIAINCLGGAYLNLGQQKQALQFFGHLLTTVESPYDKAAVYLYIAKIYQRIGQPDKAMSNIREALTLSQTANDPVLEGPVLNTIGKFYLSRGQPNEALEQFRAALELQDRDTDSYGKIVALSGLGSAYCELGQAGKALGLYKEAFALLEKWKKSEAGQVVPEESDTEASLLSNIGVVYETLDQPQNAAEYLERALVRTRETKDRITEATVLLNLGHIYRTTGRPNKALDMFQQGLKISGEMQDRRGEQAAESHIGATYLDLGDLGRALDYLNRALKISGDLKAQADQVAVLINIGRASLAQGNIVKALQSFNQAVPLAESVDDPALIGELFARLMDYWRRSGNSTLAIFYGKQSVNAYQRVRQGAEELDASARKSVAEAHTDAYRELADLLVRKGALYEAREVLDLLKEQEYEDFVRGAPTAEALSETHQEEAADKQLNELKKSITQIDAKWSELNSKTERTPEEQAELDTLSTQLFDADKQFQSFLQQLEVTFKDDIRVGRTVEKAKDETAALQGVLKRVDGKALALYTLVTPDRYVVLVVPPDGTMKAGETVIRAEDLREKIFAWTGTMADRHAQPPVAAAQELYRILLGPIENEIQGAQTLVWSLDDVLRYMPPAALHDDKQYLVERFRNVVITPASIPYLDKTPVKVNLRALAMGVSKRYDPDPVLVPLPAVPAELESVANDPRDPHSSDGALTGLIEADDSFTEKMLENKLSNRPPYSVIHIASHFVFKPGSNTTSYLLLAGKEVGGGTGFRLSLEELQHEPRLDFTETDLLTLSACSTAAGSTYADGKEVDGLAMLVHRKHANAVLATLWEVNDISTAKFMADFYGRWAATTNSTSKTEALQQAQIDLMHTNGVPATPGAPTPTNYSHPFYWAPFVLMGNWK